MEKITTTWAPDVFSTTPKNLSGRKLWKKSCLWKVVLEIYGFEFNFFAHFNKSAILKKILEIFEEQKLKIISEHQNLRKKSFQVIFYKSKKGRKLKSWPKIHKNFKNVRFKNQIISRFWKKTMTTRRMNLKITSTGQNLQKKKLFI